MVGEHGGKAFASLGVPLYLLVLRNEASALRDIITIERPGVRCDERPRFLGPWRIDLVEGLPQGKHMKGGGGERGRRGGYEVSNLGGSEPARPLVEAKFDLTDGAFDVEMLDTQIAPTITYTLQARFLKPSTGVYGSRS